MLAERAVGTDVLTTDKSINEGEDLGNAPATNLRGRNMTAEGGVWHGRDGRNLRREKQK